MKTFTTAKAHEHSSATPWVLGKVFYPQPFVKVALGSLRISPWRPSRTRRSTCRKKDWTSSTACAGKTRNTSVHLEFRLEHQADLPERMFTYNALLTATYERPVLSAVIYLERRNYRELPREYVVEFRGQKVHTFPYLVIGLWEYAGAIASRDLSELSPLLILTSEEKDENPGDAQPVQVTNHRQRRRPPAAITSTLTRIIGNSCPKSIYRIACRIITVWAVKKKPSFMPMEL